MKEREREREREMDIFGAFFASSDQLPWTDSHIISECEKEAAGEGTPFTKESDKTDSYMRLAWALVHSTEPADVKRGISMLEAALPNPAEELQRRETLYLLAVGHYRAGDYSRARRFVDLSLEISPDFRQGKSLHKMIKDKITKDGIIGIGLAVAAVGIVTGGVVAALLKKK